jgi:two-component sensor histidine kinase/integral membrane sensor domain MASE1
MPVPEAVRAHRRRQVRDGLLAGLAYLALAWPSLASDDDVLAIVWLPNALLLGLMLRRASGTAVWLLAALVAALAANLLNGAPLAVAAAFALANGLGTLASAVVARRLGLQSQGFAEPLDATRLMVVACVVGPVLGGLVAAVMHPGHALEPAWLAFGRWWSSDALGMVALLPPLLAWGHGRPLREYGARLWLKVLTLLALTVFVALLAYLRLPGAFILPVLPLLYAAFVLPLFALTVLCGLAALVPVALRLVFEGQPGAEVLSPTEAGIYAITMVMAPLLVASAYAARKRADLRSREAAQRLERLLARSPVATVGWRHDGSIHFWSESASALLGWGPGDAIGQPVQRMLPGVLELPDEESGERTELMLPASLGRQVHVGAARARLDFGDAEGLAGLVTLVDMTPRVRREAERIEAVRVQRDALVRELHHRIKNHLQGVAGLLRRPLGVAMDPARVAGVLEGAADQVLAIATVYGLSGSTSEGRAPLADLVARIALSVQEVRAVDIDLADDLVELGDIAVADDDAVPVALVINELLTNAAKHRAPGTRVRLHGERSPARVVLVVTNATALPLVPGQAVAERAGGQGLRLVRALLPPKRAGVALACVAPGIIEARLWLDTGPMVDVFPPGPPPPYLLEPMT